jgi:two-component system chemotaxis sensor kinase CheA
MTTVSLTQDIQDLSMDVLLVNSGTEHESLALALQRLAKFIDHAAEAGAQDVAAHAERLITSVNTTQSSAGAKDAITTLLQGLKELESNLAQVSVPAVNKAPAKPAAELSLAEDPELLQDFVVEAREHLGVMETQLLALEQNPDDPEPTHACFRAIHTIKGVAGFLELNTVREVAHEGETLLDEVRNNRLKVVPALIDVLLQTADFLEGEVNGIAASLAGNPAQASASPVALLERLRRRDYSAAETNSPKSPESPAVEVKALAVEPAEEPAAGIQGKSTAVETAKAQAISPVPPQAPAAPQTASTPAAPVVAAAASRQMQVSSGRTVKIDMEKLDYLADMVGELVVTQSMLRPEGVSRASADTPLARNLVQLARITAEVQKTTMSMRMVPIGQLFQRLSRLVRDVSRQVGKTVELDVVGEEIELDRSIVEELQDPLLHMVRNSIDHGIETPVQRKELGKNPCGRILLKAKHDAGQVQIEISDDGRGLDRTRILDKAKQKGLVSPNVSLSDSDILNLIFLPGFSTAEKVTDLSGRGVGMDVVRKQIQKLRGRVDVRSVLGQGSTFVLRLPLTLAIIDGLVIGVGAERFVVPIAAVKEVLRPSEEMIFTVEAREEMVMVRDNLLPLIRLHRWLGIEGRAKTLADGIIIVVESHGKAFCLAVDELLGKQEIVIKSLGELMQNIRGIAGGAILGDGRVGLILDTDAIAGRSVRD